MSNRLSPMQSGPKRLRDDRSGTTAVIFGLILPAVIGFAGIGVETGLWYTIKRQNQSSADAGAISGALEIAVEYNKTGSASVSLSETSIKTMATRAVVQNGFNTALPNTVVINHPPVSGPLAGNAGAVEVILTQQQNSLLSGLFIGGVNIVTRAVASVNSVGTVCDLALATTGNGINVQGSPTLTMPNCVMTSNSTSADSITFKGGTGVKASLGAIFTAGGYTQGSATKVSYSLTPPTETQQDPVADPYASLSITTPSTCVAQPAGPAIPPGCYKSFKITNQAVTFSPGTYYIDGGDFTMTGGSLTCPTCVVGGAGVTIILTTTKKGGTIGAFNINGNATLQLNAPATGPYAGVLFYQDRNAKSKSGDSTILGGAGTTLVGAIYTPSTNLTFSGNSGSTCSLVIAKTITFTGNSTMDTTGCATVGATPPQAFTMSLSE